MLASFWIPYSEDTDSVPNQEEKPMSLVSVDGKKYVELCENAKASTDDQSALLKTHQRAAKAKRPLYIINKSCLASLEKMQGGSDDTAEEAAKAVAAKAVAAKTAVDKAKAGGSNGDKLTLVQAVRKLDPANDEHWTTSGQPAMKAVEALFGKNVTRAAVEEVAPGYDREAATEAAE